MLNITKHPNFTLQSYSLYDPADFYSQYNNDIALIKLPEAVNFTQYIKPIPLLSNTSDLQEFSGEFNDCSFIYLLLSPCSEMNNINIKSKF